MCPFTLNRRSSDEGLARTDSKTNPTKLDHLVCHRCYPGRCPDLGAGTRLGLEDSAHRRNCHDTMVGMECRTRELEDVSCCPGDHLAGVADTTPWGDRFLVPEDTAQDSSSNAGTTSITDRSPCEATHAVTHTKLRSHTPTYTQSVSDAGCGWLPQRQDCRTLFLDQRRQRHHVPPEGGMKPSLTLADADCFPAVPGGRFSLKKVIRNVRLGRCKS